MPRIDRRDDWMLAILGDDGRRICRQRSQPHHGLVGGKRNAARSGEADPQSGEAAGAGSDGDPVERGERNTGRCHHPRDQRHQRFGMAALHRLRFNRDGLACGGVEHGGRAGIERRIECEDQHGLIIPLSKMKCPRPLVVMAGLDPAIHEFADRLLRHGCPGA
jgi:hypothetical protein